MSKFNAKNERIKHRYLAFLSEAKRLSTSTVDQVAAALSDFEASTGFRDFRLFRIEQAQRYKRHLNELASEKSGRPLAKATIASRLASLKAFFQWLSLQSGFRSYLNYSDAEYFNPSANDSRIAKTTNEKIAPTIEQVHHVLAAMPARTDIEMRDRALIAFALLSGARDNAIASLSMRHIDLEKRRVHQDPRQGVRTKNSKLIISTFFPVGREVEAIVREWVQFLKLERLWGLDDPLFPTSKVRVGESGHYESAGLERKHWKSAAAIRAIFKASFNAAGLPYFNPHSFRDTLATLGEQLCRTPEEFKAWSQNLGHENVLTTLTSYGSVAQHRQDEILARIAAAEATASTEEVLAQIEKLIVSARQCSS